MKKLFIFLTVMLIGLYASSQTLNVFHENFEMPSLNDSIVATADSAGFPTLNFNPWSISTHLYKTGLRSDSLRVHDGKTFYLTTNSFSTLGKNMVSLRFSQICKLAYIDGGTIEVSINDGLTWTQLGTTQYQGNGVLANNRFSEYSYTSWLQTDTVIKPNNTWWKDEIFDISSIAANQAQVKIRFKNYDGGVQGTEGRYGWLIDDINIIVSNNEINPPKIVMKTPVIQDSVSYTGPFQIFTYINDISTISTVNLIYNLNGGSDIIVPMTNLSDSIYKGEIPSFTYNNSVSYRIEASDIYLNQSISSIYNFSIKKLPIIVQIGTGTSTSYYSPIYVSSATSTSKYSYHVSLFTASELNKNGYIKSIAWNKANTNAYTNGNATFKIYLKEVTSTSVPSSYTSYTSELSGATLVYSSTTQNITANTGWDTFNFNVDSFNYSGLNNILVMVEFYRPGNANGSISYYYTYSSGKAYTFYGSSSTPSSSISSYLPNIKFGISTPNFKYDAGITEVSSPTGTIVATSPVAVKVRVKNFGTEILTKTKVHWAVDGIYQGFANWTGSLAQDMVSTEFTVGNHTFGVGPHTIKSWTELPNDSIDAYNINDTISGSLFSCSQILNGTYTVGGINPDFSTISDAVSTLTNCGINGPVVFNIAAGNYSGQYTLPSINGASSVNTIKFQSANNDSTSVVLNYAATSSSDNFIFKLNGAKFVTIKNLKILPSGTTYANGILITNAATNNSIEGNYFIGIQGTAGTYSLDKSLIRDADINSSYNVIKGNRIQSGSVGISFIGSSATQLSGIEIKNNMIIDFGSYGVEAQYTKSIIIDSNLISSNITNTAGSRIGVKLNYVYDSLKVTKNTIIISSNSYNANGIYIGTTNTSALSMGLIANNMITIASGTNYNYGFRFDPSSYLKIYYNSIYVNGTNSSDTRGINIVSGVGNEIKNNNIQCNYQPLWIENAGVVTVSNYNNFYTSATSNTFKWGSSNYANFAAYQTGSSMDANSISVNPIFISSSNLHVNNPAINAKGTPIAEITNDIDGNLRNSTTPDLGADEFEIILNDAGITEISGFNGICNNTQANITVKLKNYGLNPLTTATINWQVNGISQTPFPFTGNILTYADTTITIGTYTMLNANIYSFKSWASQPNAQSDIIPSNDTILVNNIKTALPAGNYTIGGTVSDYSDIVSAVNDLKLNGICGPVVFAINPGTYNGNIELLSITGASATNTIVFKSANNDSTSVVLNYNSGSSDNWIVKFNGAKYFTFKNIKFAPLNSTYANSILITNGSKFNNIIGNLFTSTGNTTSIEQAHIRLEDANSTDNMITANRFQAGSMGILMKGSSNSARLDRVNISKNVIEDFVQYGIRCEYANSPVIDSNVIISSITNSGTKKGISLYYAYDSVRITRNTIILSNSTGNEGINLDNSISTATIKGLIANNFISILNGGSSSAYGIRLYPNVNYTVLANNSIYVNGSSNTDTRGINPATGSNVEVYNNNVLSNKYPNFYEGTIVTKSDNNNFYSTTGLYGYYSNTTNNYTSLAALVVAYQKDSNSISVNPGFFSNTDLHSENVDLFAKAKALPEVAIDIDGNLRTAFPCIGADEFTVLANDIKLKALYTLGNLPKNAGSPHFVKAIVKNMGSVSQSNIGVTLNISGVNNFVNTKTITTLNVGAEDTITFDPFTPANLGANNVKVSLPTDDNLANNEINYFQKVTDTVFGYADTSKATINVGFGANSGMLLTKYYVKGNKAIKSISAYISNNNTIGKQVYGVMLNSNGVIIDTSFKKTISANDTNTWVKFDLSNPSTTTTSNDYFYAGIAQVSNASAFNPLGSQTENPARANAYYTASLNGSSLTQKTDMGRFMINANIGNPANNDIAIISNNSPNSGCGLSSEIVNITIQNKGTDTIFGGQNVLKAYYGLNINGNIINTVSQQITDTLKPAELKNISFNVSLNVIAPIVDSTYNLVTWVELTNDPFSTNDTICKNLIVKYTPLAPVINPVSIPYATTATLTAISTDTVFWYNQAIGGNKIAQGSVYTTPVLFTTDTLWAEATSKFTADATIGNGTLVNNSDDTYAPCPYANYYKGSKQQYLITASELQAMGVVAGSIKSLAFDVVTPIGQVLHDYNIKLGLTNNTALNSMITSGLNTVYTNNAYTCVTGWNNHVFNAPFIWDGTSNLIIEACYDNQSYGLSYTTNAIVNQTATSFISAIAYNYDYGNVCSNTGSTTYSQRPNMRFVVEKEGCTGARSRAIVTVATPPANEAGVLAIINPSGPVQANTLTQVIVKVKNHGSQPLTSFKVNHTLNSIVKPQFVWNATSTPLQPDSTIDLNIGSFTLAGGLDTLIAWTSEPNNAVDGYMLNDTAKLYFSTCFSGNFTVGNIPTADFQTIGNAIAVIGNAGICSSVVLNVLPGTYTGNIIIPSINGTSPTSTLTIKSSNNDSTSVVLQYDATGTSDNYVVKLNGTNFITLKGITFKALDATYAKLISLEGNASNISLLNNVFIGTATTSTSDQTLITSASASNDTAILISNNVLKYGWAAIYIKGISATDLSTGIVVRYNNFIDQTSKFAEFSYLNALQFYNNNVTSASTYTAMGGVLLDKIKNNWKFYNNNIALSSGTSAIQIWNCNSSYGNEALFYNNMISQGGASIGHMFDFANGTAIKIYHNTFNRNCSQTTDGETVFINYYGGNTDSLYFYNNIFVNSSSNGYLVKFGGGESGRILGNNILFDYNDYYTSSSTFCYKTTGYADLAAWKAGISQEVHAKNLNPQFIANNNLHISNYSLKASGIPLAEVTTDIDGQIRSTTLPDIGADELQLYNNDAGILSVTSPTSPGTSGNQAVKVLLTNYGTTNLTSAIINWSVNSAVQTPFVWTGGNLAYSDTITVNAGTFNFGAGNNIIKAWTSLPNNVQDQLTLNDTASTNILFCNGPLSGSFTVGNATSNYSTINSAITALTNCGIAGPVVFNIVAGNYSEQNIIPFINGVSAINTITFQSANNDSTSVVFNYSATTSANNYVFKLDGAKYIKIKKLSINPTGTTYSNAIVLTNSATNNIIEGNLMTGIQGTAGTTSVDRALLRVSDANSSNNIINANRIVSGSIGIYFAGTSSISLNGIEITKNVIVDFGANGIEAQYTKSIVIESNTINSSIANTYGTRMGIKLNYPSDSLKISKNKIIITSNSYNANGIYIGATATSATAMGLIANNMISITNGTYNNYGLRFDPSSYLKIYNNSINVTGTSTTDTRGINIVGGVGNIIKNNNIACNLQLLCIESAGVVAASDNNNFYTTNTTNAYKWGASSYNTLAALQIASTMDSNSVTADPGFVSNTDLHANSPLIFAKGITLSEITTDIDGQSRPAIPCIGADEFTPLTLDAGVIAINSPSNTYSSLGSSIPVKCQIRNFGTTTITNFNVVYQIGNSAPHSEPYTASLTAGQVDTNFVFATNMNVIAGHFDIKVYTSLTNDGNNLNDTTIKPYYGTPIKNIPYADNFDLAVSDWFSDGITSQWEHGIPNASVINSAYSSPNVWTTKLNGNYAANSMSYLYSPIFNNTVMKADTLKFNMWMNAANTNDGGYIEYYNNVNGWTILGSFAGDTNSSNWYNSSSQNMWTSNTNGWQLCKYKVSNLNNLSNSLQFRFVFKSTSTSTANGWAIDDFELTLAQIHKDAGVVNIVTPTNSSVTGEVVTPVVTLKNFGLDALTSIPVKYSINGQAPISSNWTGNLLPGNTIDYTLPTTYNVTNTNYNIAAYTALTGDFYLSNDSSKKDIIVLPALLDVGVSEIINPGDTVIEGSTVIVSVLLKNYGTTPLTTIPVTYQRGSQPMVTGTWIGNALNLGDTVTFTFPTTFLVPMGTSFSFNAFTTLTNDAYTPNNKKTIPVIIKSGNSINEFDNNNLWLGQNMPNPSRDNTIVEYYLPENGLCVFEIINLIGQKVYSTSLLKDQGKHSININTNELPNGAYYYTLIFEGKRLTKKLIISK